MCFRRGQSSAGLSSGQLPRAGTRRSTRTPDGRVTSPTQNPAGYRTKATRIFAKNKSQLRRDATPHDLDRYATTCCRYKSDSMSHTSQLHQTQTRATWLNQSQDKIVKKVTGVGNLCVIWLEISKYGFILQFSNNCQNWHKLANICPAAGTKSAPIASQRLPTRPPNHGGEPLCWISQIFFIHSMFNFITNDVVFRRNVPLDLIYFASKAPLWQWFTT